MIHLDLRVINQFLCVADELSFRKAAERLHISQPPLSVAIRQLEEGLGFALFTRSNKGVSLTAAGVAFRSEAQKLVEQSARAVQIGTSVARGDAGSVRVAFIGSAMLDFLPRVIGEFRKQRPHVQLKLTESLSVDVARLVELGRVDIGLLSPPVPLDAALLSENVTSDTLVAVLPHNHRLAEQQRSIALSELADDEFVSFSEETVPAFHARIVAACLHEGFMPNIVQRASQVHTIMALVGGGLGVALLPSKMARLGHPRVSFRALSPASRLLVTQIDAVYAPALLGSPAEGFLQMLRNPALTHGQDTI